MQKYRIKSGYIFTTREKQQSGLHLVLNYSIHFVYKCAYIFFFRKKIDASFLMHYYLINIPLLF